MSANDIIFYLPMTIFFIISMVFALLWRLGLSSSWQWAAGFLQTCLGFALSAFPIEPTFDQFVSGLLYTGAAYCYGSALLIHFEQPPLRRARRALAFGFLPPHIYFVFIDESLRWDLFLIEMVFAALLACAIWKCMNKKKFAADVALLLSSSLVVFDCLFRGIFFTFVNVSSDNLSDFLHSAYNLEVHVSTITVCLFFPFSAIAAMTARAVSQHRDAALVDPLTGLSNRRGLDRKIAELSAKAPGSLAVVVCDIDHFKRINDTYGHATGDEVIVGVAKLLAAGRRTDWEIARVGGEEFILLLPGADETLASDAADEIRVRIRDFDWRGTGILNPLTASFGIAHVRDSLHYEDVLDAIKQADKALYRAKEAGRDRVVAAGIATVPEHAHPVLVCA